MSTGTLSPDSPPSVAFFRGLQVMFSTPGLVLFSTAIGFGALARDLGLTGGHAAFLSLALYALPAQVIMVDQLARGASLAAVALAVTLTAVRLLPMTVALVPFLRGAGRQNRVLFVLAVHFIAVTAWLEGNRRLPDVPPDLRLHHFVGIGIGMAAATLTGTVTGYALATGLPPSLAAALLMMTPVYFALSLVQAARETSDWLAIVLGLLLGPALFYLVPGPDLMLTGLVGGSLAYLAGRRPR